MNDDLLKKIRRLRTRLAADLLELDALEEALPKAAPEPAQSSRGNKYLQQIAVNEATGSWRKPSQLKKKK